MVCLPESLNFPPRVRPSPLTSPPTASYQILLLLGLLAAFGTADQSSSVQRSLCPRHYSLPLWAPVTSLRGSPPGVWLSFSFYCPTDTALWSPRLHSWLCYTCPAPNSTEALCFRSPLTTPSGFFLPHRLSLPVCPSWLGASPSPTAFSLNHSKEKNTWPCIILSWSHGCLCFPL